ncbi:MAG: amino acid ABC transporter substrate-binding protein [Bacteroidetes bacterium]|nr:amino acid ABC transporter substrate-binding protein [Bacteroidota bacterium]
MKIGYRQSHPPMSFLSKSGVPSGYSVDICNLIATAVEEKIGSDIEVEYIPVGVDQRFQALVDKKIDILCGATTKTLDRGEIVDFTQLTFVTGGSFMTLKGENIKNNFEGKKVGVSKATTTAISLKDLFAESDIQVEIVLFDSSEEGLKALHDNTINAFAADQVVLIGLALAAEGSQQYSILPDLFSYEPFALAVRRNDASFRLIADRVISRLYRSKKILSIYDKWLGKFAKTTPSAFNALIQINAIPEK